MSGKSGKTKKKYLVVGSNNFWYASARGKANALKLARDVVNSRTSSYGDPETDYSPNTPEGVYVYEARQIGYIENKGDETDESR
ncbi:hypothetical protein A3C21_01090 [Candidatus Kaiserbacteria bacterium RIFCSPHIGHO2_02_FULL_59_21]|uniref:Uncharacterized protein n=1 Tax=Candidatus Kaiserbacteria bacterium RIFCSPHIGHO2_02_FULL_59_21 TaxID=1798500 RepID=A0A1F6DZU9_9BACT|nr:MAG: hypothetical protein A2766_02085 [Candidatus Kaiserbacteria bacterium RIFCSPHIGHO2_01_FULL_58_22]OGG66951.1 MAG: hypothetical protein A3C21_01090 [Candidatus Kaiserbacteria bacterium RIFCSPHIGHO2_02_FULL_59_21]OGG80346.1 MAG: hypothetical protein A2952_02265 [Candidatus Kaiserbacteria bacterium RIFCSPLOWO2_01_FULL_59_34]OGG85659.1 MAG: hypothetical protein A3I47_00465 [Candidatus Kaiserbacteria bacterium RIFCSPLOWO2_02_FULL_59_19]